MRKKNDPLEKLFAEGKAPDAPALKPELRKAQPKTFILGKRQTEIVDEASKVIGLSQYIRNLIQADIEESGGEWPEHEVRSR